MQGALLAEIGGYFIVNPQEQLRVPGALRESNNVPDVLHHPMGEKGQLSIADPVGDAQQVHQGKGAFIVPVEDSGLHPAVLCHFGQIAVLGAAALQPDLPDVVPRLPGSPHVLLMAQKVLPDKGVRRLHDFGIGTEILLHQEHLRPGMLLLESQQRLGVCRPEAVDALILIPHQEQVLLSARGLRV